jgi:hypothetical protein
MAEPPERGRYRDFPASAMRCPRAGETHPLHSGGAGLRPGALRPPARSSLTAGRHGPPEASVARPPARGRRRKPEAGTEAASRKARSRAVQTPPMERPGARVSGTGPPPLRRIAGRMVAPRGAPSPSALWAEEREYGRTRRPVKEHGRRSVG